MKPTYTTWSKVSVYINRNLPGYVLLWSRLQHSAHKSNCNDKAFKDEPNLLWKTYWPLWQILHNIFEQRFVSLHPI